MPKKEPKELIVDLRGCPIDTFDDFYDAITEPCGLPDWFGRNPDALRDTLQVGGISEIVDSYDRIVFHIDRRGVFSRNNVDTRAFRSAFAGRQSQLIVHRAE
ncbi:MULTISPECIES: barstar family protein [unclassified Streptomyces]|uniref:barstar family protein n=1 Tax=unclassified Streptomyces TaxID=2593676 RepID=UPI00225971EA|nr:MULTISPECIES: barstar family protein [unclassified Streptomyces]MCX5334236.1 barstar family protein [Streptomyces sp. NBC_00140]MCX5363738.1 barstar family protein [Streptomyces sp. NBC_00124]